MRRIKLILAMLSAMLLLIGVNTLYADDQRREENRSDGAAYESEAGMEEMHADMERSCAPDQASIIEMADGFVVTFTEDGGKIENGVSAVDALQNAC